MRAILLGLAGLALAYGAVLVLAWAFQRRLIYYPVAGVPPVASVLPGADEVSLRTDDGLVLAGWFVPARGAARGTVLVLNGNAGNRAHRAPLARALADRGYAVLLFDYRGFGGNPGSPSEAGLVLDARAARRHLAARPGVDPARVALFGESLGAAVAVASAAEDPPAALVLRSPFTSMEAMGRLHYPFLPVRRLLRDRYPSAERIASVRCPLLVVAGDRDGIVPPEESRALYEAAPSPRKRWLLLRGAAHNDPALLYGTRMMDAVTAFLEETLAGGPGP